MKPFSSFSKITVQLLSLVLVFAFFAISLPQPAYVQAATCVATYTVVAGDTLSAIALKYNSTVQEIAAANNLKEPYVLTIGQKLCIPASSSSSTPSTPVATATSGSTTTQPYFTTTFAGKFVTIQTNNYPKKNIYAVNVFLPNNPEKYFLGWIKTSQSTTMQQTYQLHKDLRDARRLTVCLKNLVYDNAQCNYYIRQQGVYYLVYTWTVIYTIVK